MDDDLGKRKSRQRDKKATIGTIGREGGTDTLLLLVVGVSVLEVTYSGGKMTEIVIYS